MRFLKQAIALTLALMMLLLSGCAGGAGQESEGASRAVFAGIGTITASSSSAANAALWSSGERVFSSGQPVTPKSAADGDTVRKR